MTEDKLQPGDAERDLVDDLRFVSECRFLDDFSERGTTGWPAAIRRALAAETEVRRLRAALATFVQPAWRDGRYAAIAIQEEWAAAVAAADKALS